MEPEKELGGTGVVDGEVQVRWVQGGVWGEVGTRGCRGWRFTPAVALVDAGLLQRLTVPTFSFVLQSPVTPVPPVPPTFACAQYPSRVLLSV